MANWNAPQLKTVNNNSLLGSGNITISGGSGVSVLAQSGASASVTGTLDETTLATVTIPGGTIGANESLRITPLFKRVSGANTCSCRVRLGGVDFGSANLGATQLTFQMQSIIRNGGTASAQKGYLASSSSVIAFGASTIAMPTATLDMAQDQSLTFTITLLDASDTASLEGYIVEVLA